MSTPIVPSDSPASSAAPAANSIRRSAWGSPDPPPAVPVPRTPPPPAPTSPHTIARAIHLARVRCVSFCCVCFALIFWQYQRDTPVLSSSLQSVICICGNVRSHVLLSHNHTHHRPNTNLICRRTTPPSSPPSGPKNRRRLQLPRRPFTTTPSRGGGWPTC